MTGAYTPLRGTIPDQIFKLLRAEPAGTELASAVLADRIGQKPYIVTASLASARKNGAIIARPNMELPGCPLMWSLPDPDSLLPRILPTAGADEDDGVDHAPPVQRIVPAEEGPARAQSTWMPGIFVGKSAPAPAARARAASKKTAPAPASSHADPTPVLPEPTGQIADWAQPLTDAITAESAGGAQPHTPQKESEAAQLSVTPTTVGEGHAERRPEPQGLRLALWSDGMLVVERGGERHEYTRSETTAIVAYLERLGEAA